MRARQTSGPPHPRTSLTGRGPGRPPAGQRRGEASLWGLPPQGSRQGPYLRWAAPPDTARGQTDPGLTPRPSPPATHSLQDCPSAGQSGRPLCGSGLILTPLLRAHVHPRAGKLLWASGTRSRAGSPGPAQHPRRGWEPTPEAEWSLTAALVSLIGHFLPLSDTCFQS